MCWKDVFETPSSKGRQGWNGLNQNAECILIEFCPDERTWRFIMTLDVLSLFESFLEPR